MFLAFVDGITFKNGCKITNSKDGKLIANQYEVKISQVIIQVVQL